MKTNEVNFKSVDLFYISKSNTYISMKPWDLVLKMYSNTYTRTHEYRKKFMPATKKLGSWSSQHYGRP